LDIQKNFARRVVPGRAPDDSRIVDGALETMPMTTLLYTLDESAEQLRVSTRTIRRLTERGELPFVRIGRAIRIPVASVKKWIDDNTLEGHNLSCAGDVQGGKSTCQNDKIKMDFTSARIRPTGGRVTATQAAKELAAVVGLKTGKKPMHS